MLRVLALALLPVAAQAGVTEAVKGHVLPGLDAFALAAGALAGAAEGTCDPAALDAPYQAAWDAWGPVADVRLGPSEAASLSIAFWPDERGAGPRALAGLVAAADPAALAPEAYAEQSVAARGLLALDQLLHGDLAEEVGQGGYACDLVGAVARDLAAQAAGLRAAWDAEAEALLTAGAPGNARYLSEDEAFRALYTQVLGGLEVTADARLGRPMGEFDRPRPTRAQAWRSGRPLREVVASVEASVRLARAIAAPEGEGEAALPATQGALEAVRTAAAAIDDPSFQDASDPQARLKLEILQGRVRALRDAVEAEVGAPRGIEAGFNSTDGD